MFDVISIGSATEDVFVFVPKSNFQTEECVFLPGSKVEINDVIFSIGGGSTNSAVAFSRLGLKTGTLFVIGNDESGKKILAEMKKEKVNTKHCIITKKSETSYSVILTGFGRDRVILFYRGATELFESEKINWKKVKSKWFYISSLHSKGNLLREIFSHTQKNKIKVAWNPGKVELERGFSYLKSLPGKADVFIVNSHEALMLTGSADINRNIIKLLDLGKISVITDGKNGAYCCDGKNLFFIEPIDVPIVDVTGAGDAFSSAFTFAIIKGYSLERAMQYGTVEAASVVSNLGTKNILLTKNGIEKAILKYKPKVLKTEI
ncbi:MAG: carbohydrate kinase family protein [Candidatus Diapherotrites archaeon]